MPTEDGLIRDRLAVQRTHLANERTLLAYTRTALALVITGVGVLKFFPALTLLGWIAIPGGVVLLAVGAFRFAAVRRQLSNT
jgi:putative membrane protein